MSGHDREDSRCEFTIEYVHIRPADAYGLDSHDRVARTWDGIGHLCQRELSRP
jgi:hypothetical protein